MKKEEKTALTVSFIGLVLFVSLLTYELFGYELGLKKPKYHKGDSEERQYAKIEIEESIKLDLEGHPTRHKGKRKRNKKASLEYTIQWYTQRIAEYERSDRSGSFLNYLRDGLRKAQKEYKEKYQKEGSE